MNEHNDDSSGILLQEYVDTVKPTDLLAKDAYAPVVMGIFGEVGSIMATAKKLTREGKAYKWFSAAVVEEFGDVLWYFTALAIRTNCCLPTLLSNAVNEEKYTKSVATSDISGGSIAHVYSINTVLELNNALLELGAAAAALLNLVNQRENSTQLLEIFACKYLQAIHAADVSFSEIVHRNIKKTCGSFLPPDISKLPTFDSQFEGDEQLPDQFEIEIIQRKNGQSYLKWNGVFLGDPLSDNIADPDGYRFHDVFHLSHVAILHWSPVFRALIKHKRKSDKKIDEAEDGGRAIVVEEGLTAWLFTQAKELNFFDGQDNVSLDLLKTIQQFVQGYEVDQCPLSLWKRAILDGYNVFRLVRANNGGIIVCNRTERSIKYKQLSLNQT